MFSKKPQLAVQTAAAAPSAPSRLKALAALPITNPYIGAGAAGLLLLASIGILVATGDPRAGAPFVRVSLGDAPKTAEVAAVGDVAIGEFDPNGIAMMDIGAFDGTGDPYSSGEAVITLPNGERQSVAISAGAQPLPAAPQPGLTQPGPGGLLPIIAADGRTPFAAYARPFAPNGKPRVAIVIGGLGINPTTTRQAIELLPPQVTLSFALQDVGDLQGWIDMARAYGHEVLIEIPMEPRGYPNDDPGPSTLLSNARPDDIVRKLDAMLARGVGYIGVTNYMGSKFVTTAPAMDAFSAELRRRGLGFIDDGSAKQQAGGIPRASADSVIDEQVGVDTIGYQLAQLEQNALRRGQALGSGFAYPVTVQQVAAWARGLDSRGLQLAPASAVTTRR